MACCGGNRKSRSLNAAPPAVAVTTRDIGVDTDDILVGDDVMIVGSEEEDKVESFSVPYYETKMVEDDFQVRAIGALPLGVRLHGARKLRDDGLTGKGVKVGVIDNGIDSDHPDFDNMVVQRMWWFNDPGVSHGTHVAGTIHMMAPEAEIYDYRALGSTGGSALTISEAIDEAVKDGCDIINMSLGGKRNNSKIYRAVRNAYAQGIVLCAASGNRGDGDPMTNEIDYPANYSQCINVAAVAKQEGAPVARFSNSNSQVDYAGIGVDVKSFAPNGGYKLKKGTSMACPHVCGLLCALMTKGGKYDGVIVDDESARDLLSQFTIDIGAKGHDNSTGLGFPTYLSKDEFDNDFRGL